METFAAFLLAAVAAYVLRSPVPLVLFGTGALLFHYPVLVLIAVGAAAVLFLSR